MDNFPTRESDLEVRLKKIGGLVDDFEGYAHSHAERMAILADAVAVKLNLPVHDRSILRHAVLVHDLGELVMNRDYITTNRVLTSEERTDMHRHPVIGEQEAAKRGLSRAVQLLVRWHHEWWNGSGYPDALTREQIPLPARIMRLIDTYAAVTDSRPFSVPLAQTEAKRYLSEWAGIEFDPLVVKAFLSLEEIPEIESYFSS